MARPDLDITIDLSRPEMKARMKGFIDNADGWHRCRIDPKRLTRSQRFNAKYWAACVTPLAEHLMAQEEELTDKEEAKDAAHELLVKHNLGVITMTDPATGEIVTRRKSTRKLDADAFGVFYEKCCMWLVRAIGHVVTERLNDGDPCRGLSPEGARR
jgi:hypothetical protein